MLTLFRWCKQCCPQTFRRHGQVDWSCGSERCEVKECTATVDAVSRSEGDEQWLQVEHNVTWDDEMLRRGLVGL